MEVWDALTLVPYISCKDLDNTGQFQDIFTQLHCLDPQLLCDGTGQTCDKVLFLDLDVVVLQSVEELFDLRPPAAMTKDRL